MNTLVVDVPEGHRWKTFKLLGELKIPGLVHIDSPKPSAGDSKTDPRSAIHCHFGVGSSLSIEKEMLRKWVQTQLSPFHALVGFAELVRDPHSMLLDISHTSAAVLYADLCSGMLVISPKLLVVVCTRAEDGVWKQSLTESWKADPNTTGEKLWLRKSRGDGSIFAQTQATAAQISAARARKSHSHIVGSIDKPKTLQANIRIPIGAIGNLTVWLDECMQQVATQTSIPLQKSHLGEGINIHEWRPLFAVEAGWLHSVVAQLHSELELRHLHRLIHGMRVGVGGHEAAIEVGSQFISLEDGQVRPLVHQLAR